jgi:hypothetical protein
MVVNYLIWLYKLHSKKITLINLDVATNSFMHVFQLKQLK